MLAPAEHMLVAEPELLHAPSRQLKRILTLPVEQLRSSIDLSRW
jgi:hypothetical protein